jgi:hypothetical protein
MKEHSAFIFISSCPRSVTVLENKCRCIVQINTVVFMSGELVRCAAGLSDIGQVAGYGWVNLSDAF